MGSSDLGQTLSMSNRATSARGPSSCIANREACYKQADVVECQNILERNQMCWGHNCCRCLLVTGKSMVIPPIT